MLLLIILPLAYSIREYCLITSIYINVIVRPIEELVIAKASIKNIKVYFFSRRLLALTLSLNISASFYISPRVIQGVSKYLAIPS